MLTAVRTVGVVSLALGFLVGGCDDDDSGDDTAGGSTTQTTGVSSSTGGAEDTGSANTSSASQSASDTATASDSDPTDTTSGESGTPGSSSDGGSTGEGESGSSGSTTGEQAFDEEFMWVADFMLANCVQCHANDANGMLILPDADLSYDEVRLAVDGVTANSGLQLVEPGDRNTSQTWLQITNEFGAQFPVEETDRFGDWIDAGAPYYAE